MRWSFIRPYKAISTLLKLCIAGPLTLGVFMDGGREGKGKSKLGLTLETQVQIWVKINAGPKSQA